MRRDVLCTALFSENPPLISNILRFLEKCLENENDAELYRVLKGELTWLREQSRLKPKELTALVIINITLILFGTFGATCVIVTIMSRPHLRTARNMFTLNLAVSDLTLCLFTQPFNLIRTLHSHYEWNFGEVMCKFTSFAQATNVFVATMNITAIALDRFQAIIHPLKLERKWHQPIFVLPSLWIISLLLATPMLAFSTVTVDLSKDHRNLCADSLPRFHYFKSTYGICTVLFQYIVPMVILVAVYYRICSRVRKADKLRKRLLTQSRVSYSPKGTCLAETFSRNAVSSFDVDYYVRVGRHHYHVPRQRHTNLLLTCVFFTFALAWLPLNAVNLFMDYLEQQAHANEGMFQMNLSQSIAELSERWKPVLSARSIILIQSFCLLCVLMSSCANPLLYGYFNENFRLAFFELFCCLRR